MTTSTGPTRQADPATQAAGRLHDDNCLCRPCSERRRRECLIAGVGRRAAHPDHRHPDCPSTPAPALGDEATCRTCQQTITYALVEEPGYNPRTGWSDGARRDALVCFSAIDYRHVPNRLDYRHVPNRADSAFPRTENNRVDA